MANSLFEISLEKSIWLFAIYAVLISLVIRTILSALRAWEIENENSEISFWPAFRNSFVGRGFGGERWYQNDYWHPFMLGTFELAAYPILLAGNKPEYIAGWLVLKTLPQWGRWKEKRTAYNRFLVGNALVLLVSYFATVYFFSA